MDARTRLLLEGPVGSTILRLSLPNVIVMVVQTSIGLIETYFVAKLGLDALAGMALVFPLYMLLQMVAAGAMGGGILSAVARALGSGRRDRANELVWDAVAITIGIGALTTAAMLLFAPRLYALMGDRDGSLAAATLFRCGVCGHDSVMALQFIRCDHPRHRQYVFPAAVITGGAFVLIPLSPALIFGLGPFPQLGIAGGAAAVVLYYAIGCAIFAAYIWSGRGVLEASLIPPQASPEVPLIPADLGYCARARPASAGHHDSLCVLLTL
jgi:Na+-driven multidrug efflux pump